MKELTILMPCLNEAETVGICINRAQRLLEENSIDGEILISDNGSTDSSREIASGLGARVVDCTTRGYGAALQYGIEHAEGKFVLMGDADDSYHFDEAMIMIERLREEYDLCMGTRLGGTIMPDAMPWLHRYVGNPILTTFGRIFFKTDISDFHCGMRAFNKNKVLKLHLVTTGMEWASEMVVKARLAGLRITEVPVTLYKDGRSRPPHLRRWRDGWRHLKFMLLHSPKWLFLIPGFFFLFTGLAGEAVLIPGMLKLGPLILDVHTLLVMSFMVILGVQMVFTGIFAKLYTYVTGTLPYDDKFDRTIRKFTLEKLLIVSIVIGSIGLTIFSYALYGWYRIGFSALDYQITMRLVIPSLTLIAVSVQGVFNGFMLSVLFLSPKTQKKVLL